MPKMTPAQALCASLDAIPDYLKTAQDWATAIRDGAGAITSAAQARAIYTLLGTAAEWDTIPPPTALQFPRDHAMHLGSYNEWYWVSCNLEVEDDPSTRLAVLVLIARACLINQAAAANAGWTDTEKEVLESCATVVVSTGGAGRIIRRTPNSRWAALGDTVAFGADPFLVQCGPDQFSGSVDVLPLVVTINDELNMTINLTLSSDMPAASAFFLQGLDGITPDPKPGLYYSWPQLTVIGDVTVEGVTRNVFGRGWIDHQMMGGQIAAPPPITQPLPKTWVAPLAYDGWSWCQFNLDNRDVLTCAAFQIGPIVTSPKVSYGWYLTRLDDHWVGGYLEGVLTIDRFVPTFHGVPQPTTWTYRVTNQDTKTTYVVTTDPWCVDGSFPRADGSAPSEVPVTVSVVQVNSAGVASLVALAGEGYCESVGYEAAGPMVKRILATIAPP